MEGVQVATISHEDGVYLFQMMQADPDGFTLDFSEMPHHFCMLDHQLLDLNTLFIDGALLSFFFFEAGASDSGTISVFSQ